MPQRTVYPGRRVARRVPPRRPRPAPPSRPKAPPPASPQSKRRLRQLVVSAALLLAVIAVKFLAPAALERCRGTLLELLGADTDFVEVFSAAGRAFSGENAGTVHGRNRRSLGVLTVFRNARKTICHSFLFSI